VDRGEKKETGDQERWHTGRRGRALAWLTLRFFLFPRFTSPLSKNTFSTRRKKNKNKNFFSFSVIGRENIRQYYEESVSYK
jgi:hypothetical protein